MQTVLTEKVMKIGTLILTLILTVCLYIINNYTYIMLIFIQIVTLTGNPNRGVPNRT